MNEPTLYYQPDVVMARRKGENPQPAINVDKPIAMKMRMVTRAPTQQKHYKRKRTVRTYDDRNRTFY